MPQELLPFDPQWLAVEQMMGGRQVMPVEPAEESRARFNTIFAGLVPFLPQPSDAVRTIDVTVPASNRRVRIYIPTGAVGSLPVGLYIHSGGWYAGSIENEDFLCRNIAENSKIILYSPDYRLAPECPYPAGLDDVSDAYIFMDQTASNHGGDATKKFVMGGSAGGNLTAAIGLKFATDPKLRANGLCIFVPATCEPSLLPSEYRSRYNNEMYVDTPMITPELVKVARDWYGAPPGDPLCSVLLHSDISHLPPCYIAACTKDPTHQETIFFYEECKKKGVQADLVEWVGMPHFFWIVPMMQKSRDFMRVWNEKLGEMIAAA